MMIYITTSVVIVLCMATAWAGDCPPDWVRFQDDCLVLDRTQTDWLTAQETCRVFGSHLVALQTKQKDQNLVAFLKIKNFTTADMWIDGTDQLAMGHWVWANTGEPLSYTKWASTEPDFLLTSFCMAAKYGDVDWRSRPCSDHYAFVCEKKITSSNGPLLG